MSVTILRADALALPLADESVDLVVTSPPYFGLRSYQDGGEHYAGQLGSEATPVEFVDALLAATVEMVRVLKPSGSIWVNLGDKYVADNRGSGIDLKRGNAKWAPPGPAGYPTGGMRQKSLMGIPWRYALACIDRLGLILRAEVIWNKVNGLPESVTDRVRRSHEQWFHFTKAPRYYSAIDTIREWTTESASRTKFSAARAAGNGWAATPPLAMASSGSTATTCSLTELPTSCGWDPSLPGCRSTTCAAIVSVSTLHTSNPSPCARTCFAALSPSQAKTSPKLTAETGTSTTNPTHSSSPPQESECVACACESETANAIGPSASLGRLPGSVWTVPTEPLTVPPELGVDHFAAFPTEWPRRIIAGWSPPGICVECGEGRRPVADRVRIDIRPSYAKTHNGQTDAVPQSGGTGWKTAGQTDVTITGYTCACGVIPDGYDDKDGPGSSCRQADLGTGSAGSTPGPSLPPTRPAVVLDPFSGTGTVALVADILGRHGIGVDLSADYNRLARWRTRDPNQRAKAARVDKPPPVIDGQLDLLGGLL